MKNYKNNDYAVNKHNKSIVYRFTDTTVEVSLEAYLQENPNKSEVDFAELKAISDEIYREQDRSTYRQTWKNISINDLEETDMCSASSPEDLLIAIEEIECMNHRRKIATQAMAAFTETQRRRYLMYHVDGLTTRKIALIEGVSHQ